SMPLIAGILLIVAGVFSLISFITSYLVLDLTTIESMGFITQFQQIYPDMTPEQVLGFVKTCTIVFLIIAIFPILGGILALKKKMWGIALACSIIGLFSIGILFTSSVISLIAMILLIISRNEFQ
ncbi:MAG: hypothetical protein KAH91_05470, partial [Thermoplasmatales archaeon]|nr:hypothetical protein [Thermoplasmatales archaeon]